MANSILAVKWERLFVDVGIPDKIAALYAKRFAEQRVQFEMRGELEKPLLIELGITALGDQIAILHYLKKEKEKLYEKMEVNDSPSGPVTEKAIDKRMQSGIKQKVFQAPDRDDIYHIRMPSGNVPKTKEILKKQNILRSAGLMKRGLNGVRKSGEEVRPRSKAIVSRLAIGATSSAEEVSSTTHDVYERLGVRGLVSDSLPEPKVFRNSELPKTSLRKKNAIYPAALFKRSIGESIVMGNEEPIFRVRIPAGGGQSTLASHIRRRVAVEPRLVIANSRSSPQVNHVIATGRVQKRAPVHSRLSLSRNTVVTKARKFKKPVSVFDRLS